jgi:hypothetical protein
LCFVGSSRTRFLSSSSKASRSRSSERGRRKIRSFAERSAGGRRIVRSERSDNELRKKRQKLYGIQIWIGLPKQYEETDLTSPIYQRTCCFESLGEGKILRVIADSFFGKASPVRPFDAA